MAPQLVTLLLSTILGIYVKVIYPGILLLVVFTFYQQNMNMKNMNFLFSQNFA